MFRDLEVPNHSPTPFPLENTQCKLQQHCQGNNLKNVKAAGMAGHHLEQRTCSCEQGLEKHWNKVAAKCSRNGRCDALGDRV